MAGLSPRAHGLLVAFTCLAALLLIIGTTYWVLTRLLTP